MTSPHSERSALYEIARVFGKLGTIGFGGPAAHIAMMEDETVERRNWLDRRHFLDLVGATNLIPGPNSTEMAMHVGHVRAGWRGLITAGTCFILPAVAVTAALAWAYVEFGSLPAAEPLLRGIKPAVLAIILGALWRLARTAVGSVTLGLLGLIVVVAVLAGLPEVPALLLGGLLGAATLWLLSRKASDGGDAGSGSLGGLALAGVLSAGTVSLWKLGLFFLQIGAVLYGSGYVLVAFLEGGLVRDLGWLTQDQLLDAIAIGQFTPGPVLSTATFIGYVLAGMPGAIVATAGIFLPSFLFVWILARVLPRLRRSPGLRNFLDAVNVSAVALMAAVLIRLGTTTLTDWRAIVIAVASAVAVLRWRVGSAWIVAGGALLGWLLY